MTQQTERKEIRTVDFSNFAKRKNEIAEEIGATWSTVGFFAAKNHGVSQELIDRAYAVMKDFYRLPIETKMKYFRAELKGQRGFVPNGSEKAIGAKMPDYKEYTHFGTESSYYINIWPSEIPALKETMEAVYSEMFNFSQMILELTAIYLKLNDPKALTRLFSAGGDSIIRSLYYPAQTSPLPAGTLRAAKHTDLNFITLLPNATASGLEVKDRLGDWHSVPSSPGLIICNCADMLQNMSNERLLSTEHQVVNPKESSDERFSMPFFITPDMSSDISPLKELIEGDKVFGKNFTAAEFLHERVNQIIKT